jgi:hypothetical protein
VAGVVCGPNAQGGAPRPQPEPTPAALPRPGKGLFRTVVTGERGHDAEATLAGRPGLREQDAEHAEDGQEQGDRQREGLTGRNDAESIAVHTRIWDSRSTRRAALRTNA